MFTLLIVSAKICIDAMDKFYILTILLIFLHPGKSESNETNEHSIWGDLPKTILEMKRAVQSMPAVEIYASLNPYFKKDSINVWKALPLVMGEMIKISSTSTNQTLEQTDLPDEEKSRTIPLTRNAEKCYISADEDRWCFGNCEFSVHKTAMKNSSIQWKPNYPSVGSLECHDEFFCKTWNFGTALGVAVYLRKETSYEGWDIEKTVEKVLQTRRDEVQEWHSIGAVESEETSNRCMVVIGDQDEHFFMVNWMKNEDKVIILRLESGVIIQRWMFGPSIEVNIGSHLNNNYLEEWYIGDTSMVFTKSEFDKSVQWENKDIEALKKVRRSIDKWCEENSDWLMLACKIYYFSDTQIENL